MMLPLLRLSSPSAPLTHTTPPIHICSRLSPVVWTRRSSHIYSNSIKDPSAVSLPPLPPTGATPPHPHPTPQRPPSPPPPLPPPAASNPVAGGVTLSDPVAVCESTAEGSSCQGGLVGERPKRRLCQVEGGRGGGGPVAAGKGGAASCGAAG